MSFTNTDNDEIDSLRSQIRLFLKNKGIKQRAVAIDIQCSESSLSRFLNGQNNSKTIYNSLQKWIEEQVYSCTSDSIHNDDVDEKEYDDIEITKTPDCRTVPVTIDGDIVHVKKVPCNSFISNNIIIFNIV